MSYDPGALVPTTALKYLPWAGPGFTYSLSLSLSVSLSPSDAHCHSPHHPTRFPLTTLCTSRLTLFTSRCVEEAINSSAVNQCFCFGVIDDWITYYTNCRCEFYYTAASQLKMGQAISLLK